MTNSHTPVLMRTLCIQVSVFLHSLSSVRALAFMIRRHVRWRFPAWHEAPVRQARICTVPSYGAQKAWQHCPRTTIDRSPWWSSSLVTSAKALARPYPSANHGLNWSDYKPLWISPIPRKRWTGINYASFNVGAGALFIGIGYWTLLISPSCMVAWPPDIISGVPMSGSNWRNLVLLWEIRLPTQFGTSCSLERLGPAQKPMWGSLMEIFFQHQRGAILGSYMLAISAGT